MTSLSISRIGQSSRRHSFVAGIRSGTWGHRALLGLSLGGWAFGLIVLGTLVAKGGLPVGGDLAAYLRAGEDLAAGRPVYVGQNGEAGAFNYGPPWAIAFAALAWVPDHAMQALFMTISLLAIRYVAGSWVRAGLAFWYPVTVMVIMAGNIDLLIAAAIVLAAKGHAGPLAFAALAKVAPILAVPVRQWRQAAIVIAVGLAVTLPWLHLWPEWLAYLLRQPTTIAISVGPPWYMRLPVAVLLLALRRPWASALAVVAAMPSMWLGTFTILIAAVRRWADATVRPAAVPTTPVRPDGATRTAATPVVVRPRLIRSVAADLVEWGAAKAHPAFGRSAASRRVAIPVEPAAVEHARVAVPIQPPTGSGAAMNVATPSDPATPLQSSPEAADRVG